MGFVYAYLPTFFLYFGTILGQADNNFNSLLSSVKFRISEFPPIFDSPINARSISVFNSTGSFSSFELMLSRLTKHTSKLYIEAHPSTISEFIVFLNLTASYIQTIMWMPCILLYWPEKVISSEVAEIIVLRIVGKVEKDDFPLDSEVYVAFEIENSSTFQQSTNGVESSVVVLCDLFKYKRDIKLSSQFCHIRHLDKPLSISEGYFSYHPVSTRRRDLNGTTLNIIAQYDPNYEERITLREFDNGTVEYTKGMCLDWLIALQISLNFSYVAMKGNGWTGLLPNGTWTGMSAQLINKEADLSIAQASMIMMINEMSGVSFLQVTSTGQFVALFRQPGSSANLMISVFSGQCWLAYFLTWVLLILSVHVAYHVQKKTFFESLTSRDLSFHKEVYLWALTTACAKGWYIHPLNSCFRTICVVASTMAFCTYAAYSSQMTVILVTEVLPIKNFGELTLSSLEIFTDKWLPVARNLIERVYSQRDVQIPTENSILYSAQEGVYKVTKEKSSLAFVTFADAVASVFYKMDLTDKYFCNNISSVKIASQRTPTAMFVKRGSSLKELLNYNIISLVESGIAKRLNNQYDDRTQIQCTPNSNNYRGGLSLEDIWTPYLIIAIGFSLSSLNLIFESLYMRLLQ